MITIYHNPRCSKSRNALSSIQNAEKEFKVVEYLSQQFSEETLRSLLLKLNIRPEELVRKNEVIFQENFKGKTYNDVEWIKILVENPKLIQRPIVESNSRAIVARDEESVNYILNDK
jgi:arsenate reductase